MYIEHKEDGVVHVSTTTSERKAGGCTIKGIMRVNKHMKRRWIRKDQSLMSSETLQSSKLPSGR